MLGAATRVRSTTGVPGNSALTAESSIWRKNSALLQRAAASRQEHFVKLL